MGPVSASSKSGPLGRTLRTCLFCLNSCLSLECSFNIPGAKDCDVLGRQLVQLFIAKNLLDMPREWCEVTLSSQCEQISCGDDKKKDLVKIEVDCGEELNEDEVAFEKEKDEHLQQRQSQWFNVCVKCSIKIVEPAWQAYQDFVAAERKIRKIKEEVRETMKQRILGKRRNKMWCGLRGDGVDVQIRNWIFPELLNSSGKISEPEIEVLTDDKLENEKRTRTRTRLRTPRVQISFKEDKDKDNDACTNLESPPDSPEEIDFQNDMEWEITSNLSSSDADDRLVIAEANPLSPVDPPPKPTSKKRKRIRTPSTKASTSITTTPKKRIRKRTKKTSSTKTTSSSSAPPKKRIRIRKPRRLPENLKRFKCLECGSYFDTAPDLHSHTEAHQFSKQNGGGPHDCDKCSYAARTSEELQLHIKKRHTRIRSHHCTKCNFRAKSWLKLRDHLTTQHASELTQEELENPKMSLKCQVCSRQFNRLENMVIHQKKLHPELFGEDLQEPIDCPECSRKFASNILLDHHIQNKHIKKDLKFVCDECGKAFEWKSKLERHKVLHFKDIRRDHVCHLCGLDYAYPDQLIDHHRKIHPGETEAGGIKPILSSTSAAEDEFKCRYCDLTSPYKVVIQRHLKTHKEERGYRCDKCGSYYMTEQSLRRHKRINHSKIKEKIPCPHCMKPFASLDYMKHHVANFCRLKGVASKSGESVSLEQGSPSSPEQKYQSENEYQMEVEIGKVEISNTF